MDLRKKTQREIKFRAWEEELKKFYYFDLVTLSRKKWSLGEWAKLPKQQYTGLKDKNGKEIYEGDILRHYNEFASLGEPKEFVREVKWDTYYGAGWNFGLSYKDGEKRWSYPQPGDCEVIGNIYENPELLEEK